LLDDVADRGRENGFADRPKEKPAKSLHSPLAASWPVVTRSRLCGKRAPTTVSSAAGRAWCALHFREPSVAAEVSAEWTDDLSLKMLLLLVSGVGLWVVYGVFKNDVVIVLANGATLVLLSIILYFKLRYPHDAQELETRLERSREREDVRWQRSA